MFSCVQHNYLLASKRILNENFGRGYGERTSRGFSVLSCWWRSGRVTGLNDSLQQLPLSSVDDIWNNRPHWRGHALREASHSLWSSLVIVVAVADLLGVLYFLYSPVAQALLPTLVASVGPLLALIGGVIGLAWKPIGVRSSNQSLNA